MSFFPFGWSRNRSLSVSGGAARRSKPRPSVRLRLEALEDRTLLAVTITRTGATDYVTIQNALNNTIANDVVNIDPGTYQENLTITTPGVTLKGAQHGQDANARFLNNFTPSPPNGPKAPTTGPTGESVLTALTSSPSGNPNTAGNDLIHVEANGVTIDGLVIDGNNPALTHLGGITGNGVPIDARIGITNLNTSSVLVPVSNLVVENDIIQNFAQHGVSLDNNGTVGSGNLITGNVIHNFGSDPNFSGNGVILLDNAYADVTNNTITDEVGGETGIQLQRFDMNGSMTWSGNHITVGQDGLGIIANVFMAPNGVLNVTGNTVNVATGVTGASDLTWGIYLLSIESGSTVNATGNTVGSAVGQFARGYYIWNAPTSNPITISGGTVANSLVGIDLESVDPQFGVGSTPTSAPVTVNVNNVAVTGGNVGVQVQAVTVNAVDPIAPVIAHLTGVIVNGATTGVLVEGFSPSVTATATLFRNTITGATTGVQVDADGILGTPAQQTSQNIITGNTTGIAVAAGAGTIQPIIDNNLSGNSGLAVSNSLGTLVDASLNWWGVNTAAGVAAKAGANVDYTPFFDSGLNTQPILTPGFNGDFSVLDVAAASPEAGAAGRIQEGVNDVLAGGTVNVTAGTYAENVSITKSLTLAGVPGNPPAAVIHAASGDGVAITGPATNVTVKDLEVTGAANGVNASGVATVTLENLKLDGDGNGFMASNLATLNLANLTLPAVPGQGGTIRNVSAVNFDASGKYVGAGPGRLTSILGAPVIGYSGVTTLNLNNASAVDAIAGPDTADRATAFIGLTADERFVQALYLADLGRVGAKAELDGWAAVFGAPGFTQAQAQAFIAAGIEHSQEAEDHLVQAWYVTYLGRQAVGGEEQGWVNALLGGATEELVLSGILGSPEFYARAQTLVSSGTADERYVRALYLLLLNRTGEASGVASFVSGLATLGRQGDALDMILGSNATEFRTDQLEADYNILLHRPDDPEGLNSWLMANLDSASVRIGFETSPEFFTNG